jgi:hypothetical protein
LSAGAAKTPDNSAMPVMVGKVLLCPNDALAKDIERF